MLFETRKKQGVVTVGIILLTVSLLIVSVPPAKAQKAQFVLAGWDSEDEYGQGIIGLKFWENSTGAWEPAPYYTHYYPDYHEELGQFYYVNPDIPSDYMYNLTAGASLKMRVDAVLNATLVNPIDFADGQNYLRHSVAVTTADIFVPGIHTVFSQQNFTYSDGNDLFDPVYYYEYEVILNFILQAGALYTVTVIYEIFY